MKTGAGECAVLLQLMGHNTCIWTLTAKLWIPSLQFSSGEMAFEQLLSASKWTLNFTVTWTFWQSEQVALTELVMVAAMVGLRVLFCILAAITWDMHKQEQPWPCNISYVASTHTWSFSEQWSLSVCPTTTSDIQMLWSWVHRTYCSVAIHIIHTSYIHGLYVIHTQHHKPLQIPLKAILNYVKLMTLICSDCCIPYVPSIPSARDLFLSSLNRTLCNPVSKSRAAWTHNHLILLGGEVVKLGFYLHRWDSNSKGRILP